jgi:hypothetical protein
MNTHNLNEARYVRSFEDSPLGSIMIVWYGGTLFVVLDQNGYELDCWNDAEGIADHCAANKAMEQHIEQLQKEENAENDRLDRLFEAEQAEEEQDHIEEMEYRETQEEARSAWLAS